MDEVHPDLVRVATRALQLSPVDFGISEGARSLERQRILVNAGASTTMNSRHLVSQNGFAHAIDIYAYVDGRASWDWPLYGIIAASFKQAARELNIPIEWGGDWKTFFDGPHFQLPRKPYSGDK
jgi:peptidoglycan LD-endopeptidase CwlK